MDYITQTLRRVIAFLQWLLGFFENGRHGRLAAANSLPRFEDSGFWHQPQVVYNITVNNYNSPAPAEPYTRFAGAPYIDNLIKPTNAENLSEFTEQKEDFMQIYKLITKRGDGKGYRWRFQKDKISFEVTGKTKYIVATKAKAELELIYTGKHKKQLAATAAANDKPNTLYSLCKEYYERYIYSKVKLGKLKECSARRYADALKYIVELDEKITRYSKDDVVDFFNEISAHRTGAYCYFLIKNTFANETEKGTLTKNKILNLENPFSGMSKKGTWFNIQEQQLIMDNLKKCDIGEEILFLLMTGVRRGEAFRTTINFDKCIAFVDGTKTKTSSRYVNLSQAYCEHLKKVWHKMFNFEPDYYTRAFRSFLDSLGIEGRTLHSLRHTFASNLFYLDVKDVTRQYLMGHKSIVMTNDIYTTLDRTVKKPDILNVYGNLYPDFN